VNNEQAKRVASLIEENPEIVEFGSSEDAPSEDWIARAEARLHRQLPDSYKWFLREYGGGEIGGDEVYSIYEMDFETVNGCDIVFQHLMGLKSGDYDDQQLMITTTSLGEYFFLDYTRFADGECPVCQLLPSGKPVEYAKDFVDFLEKRIRSFL